MPATADCLLLWGSARVSYANLKLNPENLFIKLK